MACRPRRRLAVVLTTLAVTACATATGEGSPTTTSTSIVPSTSTTTSTTTTVPASSVTSFPDAVGVEAEVTVPEGEGPFPAVVVVHGGGWVAGNPALIEPLADHLSENGFLTVNTRYTLADHDRPAFPTAVEDVACAVSYAAGHPESDGTVAVIGYSAGAHIGALVALTGDRYVGNCPFDGSGVPERFVGLAGPYDVTRIGLAVAAFFGGGPERVPELWEAGNPQFLTGENTGLDSLIMYGERDGLVPETLAFDFYDALVESGSQAFLEQVEGARHNDMHDPEVVGDLIVTWLER